MEIIWSLGVTDNTEHYGCFDKGSNPLETSYKSGCPRGEEVVCKTIHIGSNPILDSVVVAQLVRASDCGSEGRRFNSDQSPHIAGRMVPHRSHKPSVPGSTPGSATKRFDIILYIRNYFISL